MSTTDHAPVIAAHLLARVHAPGSRDPDFLATVHDLWPEATDEEARRGLLIAHELIEADLAELSATTPPPPPEPDPGRRAVIVAGIAAILSECAGVDDLGEALHRIGVAYPDLTWPCFRDALDLSPMMWPGEE